MVGKTFRITCPENSKLYFQFTVLEITGDNALISIREQKEDGYSVLPFVPTTKKTIESLLAEEKDFKEVI